MQASKNSTSPKPASCVPGSITALLRQYGPCVLLGDEVLPGDLDRDDVKMNLPRSSYDECVDYIVGELDDMIDNNRLPLHFTVQADKDYGRATLAMCMGLKSRVLLLAASDQFNGNPAYANVVNTDGKHLFRPEKTPKSGTRPPRLQKMSSTWEFSTSTRSTTPTERSTLTCPAATFSWRTGTAR